MTRHERRWLQGMRLLVADPRGWITRFRIKGWVASITGGVCVGITLALWRLFGPVPAILLAAVGGYLFRLADSHFATASFATFAPRYLNAEPLDPPPAP